MQSNTSCTGQKNKESRKERGRTANRFLLNPVQGGVVQEKTATNGGDSSNSRLPVAIRRTAYYKQRVSSAPVWRVSARRSEVALLVRIYYNAVFGALGGLLGWMLFGVFGDKNPTEATQWLQMIIGGTIIGGAIGYFVVSVDAVRDQALAPFRTLGLLWRFARRDGWSGGNVPGRSGQHVFNKTI